jgi:N-6 DNA Methylase/TaqI-like C-terminal specificity domain
MELFDAAGIPLPSTGGAKSRRKSALDRALGVPLFNYKVIREAIGRANLFELTPERRAVAADYARKVRDPKFLRQKELRVREMMVQDVLQSVLGYTPYDPGRSYTLARERTIRSGAVDVALGRFNQDGGPEELLAPFELKGPETDDLDRVMPGRGRSPVQQAWDYAIDSPGSQWVLVSNCLEIRLYGFGRGRSTFERFELAKLDDPFEQDRLWVILGAKTFLAGGTEKLLRDTDSTYKDITDDLYKQYATLRRRLVDYLASHAALSIPVSVQIAQKLLDRILFIAFAQRTDLMADKLLEQASKARNSFAPQPLWKNFLGLFSYVDRGNSGLDIPAYNGGLFATDPIADALMLPDHLAEEVARLGQWDYRNEVPVTVLGHLFEQSITDLEVLRGGTAPQVSKRKREGVVYTPDFITRFLVERTIALSLDERQSALWASHDMDEKPDIAAQVAFWQAYLGALRDFTIVDPACGSGAFLVAAFEEMARRYRDAVTALEDLGVEIEFDPFDEITTRNLHGVDLNTESVEITRLSLWLKTARREHPLQNLEATIKDGNSVIDDANFTDHPFDWKTAFPEVLARGGFDVVIGNPPYVRMEYLKSVKPYFTKNYVVTDERTDLYAYFFEKGVEVLKPGGRLGFISSSTFFQTGAGANLRTFLGDGVGLEVIVNFGDVQPFQGVTTYPAILTLKKTEGHEGSVDFLIVKDKVPEDLGRTFTLLRQTMPRARLGKGSWQLEDDRLAALRAKLTKGRETLGEAFGPPLYGIKTGLNKAFIIDRGTRDRLINADPHSSEILKPFLKGDHIKRWQAETEDVFLINTPRGKIDIEAYPSVKDWLLPFKERLEKRATQQQWWELQQAQLAYQDRMLGPKIVWPDIAPEARVSFNVDDILLDCTCFFVSSDEAWLSAVLNSRLAWFFWKSLTPMIRGGFARLKTQFVEQTPMPPNRPGPLSNLSDKAALATKAAGDRHALDVSVRRRILDLSPSGRHNLSERLSAWYSLDFAAFRAEVRKVFRNEIPLQERSDWEQFLAVNAVQMRELSTEIDAAERDMNRTVYDLFDLTPDEVALLEQSISGS